MEQLASRRYRINRRSDVQMAAVSVQRPDYYPGLSALDRTALGTVIAELGTNILKYGVEGSIRISQVQDGARQGILVEASDAGPGIPDLDRALEEHFSTGNSLGLGLPAVQRMSDELGITTGPDTGTQVRALRWIRPEPQAAPPAGSRGRHEPAPPSQPPQADAAPAGGIVRPLQLTIEQRIRPCYPERVSGDQLLVSQQGCLWLLGVVDGCGHGPEAHAVACAVVEALQERFRQLAAGRVGGRSDGSGSGSGTGDGEMANPGPCPAEGWLEELLRTAHQRACGSRGAAIGLALVDSHRRELWFSGIGNTRILEFRSRGWTGVSRDGQLGDRFPTPIVQRFPLEDGDTVVQCSDGLRESQVRQLRQSSDPALPLPALADLLMRQALRTDDVSVLLLRCHT